MTIAILFGGKSAEHEVSLVSGQTLIVAAKEAGFFPISVNIDKDGLWDIEGEQTQLSPEAAIAKLRELHVAVVLPITHGTSGEDGTLQGFLETSGLPYIGCGVLGSALCMDKVAQKLLCKAEGVPVTPFVWTTRAGWHNDAQKFFQNAERLSIPLFVKPSNQGSSVGITKIDILTEEVFAQAVEEAFVYDARVLVEQGVQPVREIEIAAWEDGATLRFSPAGELTVQHASFYSYDAEYVQKDTIATIPAKISDAITEEIEHIARRVWMLLDCRDFARIDFFLDVRGTVFLNEINTLPGMTAISMFPKLFAHAGIPLAHIVRSLVERAKHRCFT
jgi:D-alanine-D-alanine ligase